MNLSHGHDTHMHKAEVGEKKGDWEMSKPGSRQRLWVVTEIQVRRWLDRDREREKKRETQRWVLNLPSLQLFQHQIPPSQQHGILDSSLANESVTATVPNINIDLARKVVVPVQSFRSMTFFYFVLVFFDLNYLILSFCICV